MDVDYVESGKWMQREKSSTALLLPKGETNVSTKSSAKGNLSDDHLPKTKTWIALCILQFCATPQLPRSNLSLCEGDAVPTHAFGTWLVGNQNLYAPQRAVLLYIMTV